jgi:hypothetical protein
MEPITFFSVVYAVLVLLGGVMRFWFGENILSFFFEITSGVLILISLFFIAKGKTVFRIVIFAACFLLSCYFWYFFYATTAFFTGVMSGLSTLFTIYNGWEVFKLYGKP